MDITPPYGYNKVIPFLRNQRIRMAEAGALPPFALNTNALPVTISEIGAAGRDYPVVFAPTGSSFSLLAILGVVNNENMFVDNGAWLPNAYVPAYVRRYPFCMTRIIVDQSEQQRIICVEEEHVSDDGLALFNENLEASPQWTGIETFLNQFEADLEHTQEFCSILADFKLLQPYTLQANLQQGGELKLDGIYCIDEQRLEHLTSSQLKTLIRKGAMRSIYQHLASVPMFNRLLEMKAQRMSLEPAAGNTTPDVAANDAASITT